MYFQEYREALGKRLQDVFDWRFVLAKAALFDWTTLDLRLAFNLLPGWKVEAPKQRKSSCMQQCVHIYEA